jgi:hypothetical protein
MQAQGGVMTSFHTHFHTHARRIAALSLVLLFAVGCTITGRAKKIHIPLICEAEDVEFSIQCDPARLFESLSPEDRETVRTEVCRICTDFERTQGIAERLSRDTALPAPARQGWKQTADAYAEAVRQCKAFETKTGACPHSP